MTERAAAFVDGAAPDQPGANVRVVLARPTLRLSEAARHQLGTVRAMSVSCCVNAYDLPDAELGTALETADLVVDAHLGYNLAGPPRDRYSATQAYRRSPKASASCSGRRAPTTPRCGSPGEKKAIVGIDMILYVCERGGLASTSTLTTSTASAYLAASYSSSGANIRHGTHQLAQKSTTRGRLL